MITLLFLLLGVAGIIIGAELTVDAAKKFAKRMGVSEALIGLTVISIGTSLPEISVNVGTGISNLLSEGAVDASGVAVGTNIGSCLIQITLILGITGLLAGHLKAEDKTLKIDGIAVLGAISLFFLAGLFGGEGFVITRLEGIALIIIYILYLIYTTKQDHLVKRHDVIGEVEESNTLYLAGKGVIGLGLLIGGAHWVVSNAVSLSQSMGVSQGFVGIMIVGAAGGLPELTTAVTGVLKNAKGISIGTLIGSNITDPLFSLGSGAAVSGFTVDSNLLFFDIPYWFFSTILAIALVKRGSLGLDRKESVVLILNFAVYVFLKIRYFT